jgi:membrane-associated phospholipid phosphatase
MPAEIARVLGRAAALAAALFALMVGLGLLLTHGIEDRWPLTEEDELNESLAAARTPTWDHLTYWLSWLGNTGTIVVAAAVVAVVFRRLFGRWRESAFVVLAVATQAAVFLATTLVIDRRRPAVEHLDVSPPTSSFPSGHTGAATALYLSVAVVLAWRTRRVWARPLIVATLLIVPLSIGTARLYRGMHHPSDIVGSLVNGSLSVVTAARTMLLAALPPRLAARLDRTAASLPPAEQPLPRGTR